MSSLKAKPLLKFAGNAASLAPEGLELVRELGGHICPIIFVGDGRSGKSYLASCLVDAEDAFVSSDSAESVTEGIDVLAVPVSKISDKGFGEQDEHLLVMDCEGGNNAMAAIRTLVNVFGLLLGSQVVFVANGMATEQALQTLGMSLAARSLVRLEEGTQLPTQELVFVVNKNTLRYEGSALEKILEQKFDDPGRQELRDTVRECFPSRSFFTVPLMGMPSFSESVRSVREHLVEHRTQLQMGGVPVLGRQLAGVMELIVAEVRKSEEISVPSMNRYVIYEGFLLPLTTDLTQLGQSLMSEPTDYEPNLAERNPIPSLLGRFDESSAHIGHTGLKMEARQLLEVKLRDLWHWVEVKNEAFGNEVCDTVQEGREVELSRSKSVVGVMGLLKEVVVTKQLCREEGRTVLHRKKGGEPECLPWKSLGTTVTRTLEWAFTDLPPSCRGFLRKASPNGFRSMLRMMRWDQQPRICVVQDGHFLWFDEEGASSNGQAKGCINFLIHKASIEKDGRNPSGFIISPAQPEGWQNPSSFTGNSFRSFTFDASDSEINCDAWISAIAENIHFANLAAEQLGPELFRQVRVYKPTFVELET
ncbi:unnamed protein product [Durusdinium trenchii]|uniref:Uncharacterized protein n=3 Tax=Durusdinium trenchii TaxID=1381693 RepID=A0ABP0MU87_9DINO